MSSLRRQKMKSVLYRGVMFLFLTIIVAAFSCMQTNSAKTDESGSMAPIDAELDMVPGKEESETTAQAPLSSMRSLEQKVKKVDAETDIGLEAVRKLSTSDRYRARAPQLLSRINSSDLEPIPLVMHDITVVIVGHKVRVIQDLVFKNPGPHTLAGSLMIELPDGASPSYLGMFQGQGPAPERDREATAELINPQLPAIGNLLSADIKPARKWYTRSQEPLDWGELRSAKVVNPIKGREVYESVTRRRIDPALAEWAGGGKFSTRIFPIPGNGLKRIVFAYDAPLRTNGGNLVYALPLPSSFPEQTRVTTHILGKKFRQPRLLAGAKVLDWERSAYGLVNSFRPEPGYSASLVFQAIPQDKNLQYLVGDDENIPGKLIHARVTPNIPSQLQTKRSGKALFILDTSYSSKEKLYSLSAKLLRSILEQDKTITHFAVLGFDVATRSLTRGFQSNTQEKRQQLYGRIEEIWLEGATNISSVFQFIDRDAELKEANSIFLLSDGQITWGVENPAEIKRAFPELLKKPWFCYSFGDSAVNRSLFRVLSHQNGQIINVTLGQDLEEASLAHLKSGYRLDAVYSARQDEILISGDPAWIYPGQTLELACRVSGPASKLDLILRIEGKEQVMTIPLEIDPLSAPLAARSWADLYAKRLLDLYDQKANEIVLALSQRFGLTNREASFIILETDQEYRQYQIKGAELNLRKLEQAARAKSQGRPFGAPQTSDLSPESMVLIQSLGQAEGFKVWDIPPQPQISSSFDAVKRLPAGRPPKNGDTELYLWAKELYQGRGSAEAPAAAALRALSTILELRPRDDAGIRLVGFVLFEWGLHKEAEELFALVRQRRPFEPQAYLLEGMAQAAQGKLKEAAIRYEIVLQREFFRFDEYTKPVAALLYIDLLQALQNQSGNNLLKTKAGARLKQLETPRFPKGRLLLFWNLDDTDVDLHVKESQSIEVYYEHPQSPSGGQLFWDNTTGLGPELYEYPKRAQQGFEVYVDYFDSSSVEGTAPAATLICAFNRASSNVVATLNWYTTILTGTEEDKVLIMPVWTP